MNHTLEQFNCIGGRLPDFIENYAGSCHLKSIQTGQYILSNYNIIKSLKFESIDDFIGLTIYDLCSDDGIYKKSLNPSIIAWKNAEIERVSKIECQAQSTKHPISVKGIYITIDGFIQLEEMKKIPIFDSENRKAVALLTCRQDITLQLGLFGVLQLYRAYYPEMQAIQQLLSYLKLNTYFKELPNLRELQILFVMRQDSRRKCIARQLNLAPGTIEVYVSKLRDKLISTIDLYNILIHLREIPVDERNQNNEALLFCK